MNHNANIVNVLKPALDRLTVVFDLARIAVSDLVSRIDYHESLGSTSDRALALAAQGETELPLLVLAEQQTAGRGRGGNRWWTARGALTFSLVLEAPPDRLPQDRWPQAPLASGLAICDALKTALPAADVKLKWPNDVYLAGRKLGGILSESVPGWRDRLVVGVGVNVNNRVEGSGFGVQGGEGQNITPPPSSLAPRADLQMIATSLIDHDGLQRELTGLLLAVLDELDRRWQDLLEGRFAAIAAAYRERCFLTGRTVTVGQPGGQEVVGVCLGIDDRGALRLRGNGGETAVVSGTVLSWDGSRYPSCSAR